MPLREKSQDGPVGPDVSKWTAAHIFITCLIPESVCPRALLEYSIQMNWARC